MTGLLLIDVSGFMFRAYHALPPLTTSTGVPTGAALGFANMLVRLLEDENPSCCAAVFDAGKSGRDVVFPEYKATRPPAPEDLPSQFALARRFLQAMQVPVFELQGFEADDVIATLTTLGLDQDLQVTIVSSDKDLMQLVGPQVRLLDTLKNRVYGEAEVEQRFGVPPEQLGDWLALVGDTSDNVPGVPGVGPKTATKLLAEWGSLENILAHPQEMRGKKLQENIVSHADTARTSRKLVTLQRDCPVDVDMQALRRQPPNQDELWELLTELEFIRLRERIAGSRELEEAVYKTVGDSDALDQCVRDIIQARSVSMLFVPVLPDAREPALLGIALCWGPGKAAYIPYGHEYLGVPPTLPRELLWQKLETVIAGDEIRKVVWDYKLATKFIEVRGMNAGSVSSDPMLAAYVDNPARPPRSVVELAQEVLGRSVAVMPSTKASSKGGEKAATVRKAWPVELSAKVFGQQAEAIHRLGEALDKQLDLASSKTVLTDIEVPLAQVLARMESRGFLLDKQVLGDLSGELGRELDTIERAVHEEAGWAVNINSPKQLQELLFDQLGLTTGRKTKTGYSTDAAVLSELALEHPIAEKIETYRTLSKLKSTYLDALPALVDGETGRIHTSFNQTVAATGRLSSSEPNLQNIPIRTAMGRRIRQAFIAPPGKLLVSADYSQIELRVLAHLSQDSVLVDAFLRDQDVHRRTAAEVFSVDPEVVSDEQRRVAKAVNFGVIYGQSDWGLARQLRIPRAAAKAYIEAYFERYDGVRRFMHETIERARAEGMVVTIAGRRRLLPDIRARRFAARSAAERMARNTPIQGSAADILKQAMICVEGQLRTEMPDASMILTIHDELLFEAPEEKAAELASRVAHWMSSVVELAVPLKVETGCGANWDLAHS